MKNYRDKRFPIITCLVIAGLSVGIWAVTSFDGSVPRRAMQSIGQTVSGLANSITLITGGSADEMFVFANQAQSTSLPMLVNNENPVPDGYSPKNLVLMKDYCDESIVTIKGSEIEGEKEAVDALMRMFQAAIAEDVSNWQISAGYRSVAYQQRVWDDYVYKYRQDGLSGEQARQATAKYVAKPSCSEHHTGLAFDVTVPGESFPLTEQSKWLAANCWDYGFIIRYTEEKVSITGINAEPWHVRYVGQPHALAMRDSGECLEEYLQGK